MSLVIDQQTALDIRADKDTIVQVEVMRTVAHLPVVYVNIDGICRFRLVGGNIIVTDKGKEVAKLETL